MKGGFSIKDSCRVATRQYLNLTALMGGIAILLTLWAWGQPLICTCGYVQFWVGSIWSSGNSQHIADWYTLSHLIHGLMIVPLGRLLAPRLSFNWLFAIAIATGVAWEIVEHTQWVLGQFRATNVNQGYLGDSVLNAVADYIFMLIGFFVASRLPTSWTIALIVLLEIIAAVFARDSFLLTTLMLIYRVEVIEAWQQQIKL
ncbi:MAG: DUF2585 family protein [Rhizobiaceae bacterium]